MGIFRRNKEKEINISELFESAEWPSCYNVTIHTVSGKEISWSNVTNEGLNIVRNHTLSGEGSFNLIDDTTQKTVTLRASQIAFYECEEMPFTMWNEDSL